MKKKINENLTLESFIGDELRENTSEITDACLPTIMSYENNDNFDESYEKFYEVMQDFAFDDDNNAVFLLLNRGRIVSFAIFSVISNENRAILELVMTNQSYSSCGFAKNLIINSMKELKKIGVDEFVSNFNVDNDESIEFHQSLLKQSGVQGKIVKDFDNVCTCNFKLKTFVDQEDNTLTLA